MMNVTKVDVDFIYDPSLPGLACEIRFTVKQSIDAKIWRKKVSKMKTKRFRRLSAANNHHFNDLSFFSREIVSTMMEIIIMADSVATRFGVTYSIIHN